MHRTLIALFLSVILAGAMLLSSCATVPETGRSQLLLIGTGEVETRDITA